MNGQFTCKKTPNASKHQRDAQNSFVIREMQIKQIIYNY